MKKWLIVLGLLIIVGVGGYIAQRTGRLQALITSLRTAQAEQQTQSNPVDAAVTENVEADARVVPVQYANLSFERVGTITSVLVSEGDQVEADQVLVRLDAGQQQIAVAKAEADLRRAQARLTEVEAGPRAQEIEQAKAALTAAQARNEQLTNANLPGEIKVAQAAVNAAQASLQKVLDGASDQMIIAARADLANAEAVLRQTQSAYDRIKWRNDIGALPESARLEQATNTYEAARARLEDLQAGASNADIAAASAQVQLTKAQLEALQTGMPPALTAAQAEVQAQQAKLDLLLAGARTETIEAAEADVAAAVAALQQALLVLGDMEVRAPFAGTIATLAARTGEQAAPGTPVLQLVDLTRWQIETEGLTELDVTGITPGQSVRLTFDAIPDLVLNGKVRYIRPIGTDNAGDVVYTVVIDPERQDPRLLWNMTVVVEFL